ncbi:hypothetical protein Q5752_006522 [Cryptotrichosporon argae]
MVAPAASVSTASLQASPPSPPTRSARAQLSTLLSQRLRISTADGRVFTGVLLSIDRAGSLLLSEAVEARPSFPLAPPAETDIGADGNDSGHEPGARETDRQANVARYYPRSEPFAGGPPLPLRQREMHTVLVPAHSIVRVVVKDDRTIRACSFQLALLEQERRAPDLQQPVKRCAFRPSCAPMGAGAITSCSSSSNNMSFLPRTWIVPAPLELTTRARATALAMDFTSSTAWAKHAAPLKHWSYGCDADVTCDEMHELDLVLHTLTRANAAKAASFRPLRMWVRAEYERLRDIELVMSRYAKQRWYMESLVE